MLSILIPTYNYNVYPLAENLQERALKSGVIFELICIDDGSYSSLNESNEKINTLPNCTFIEHDINQGRTATRQALAEKAQYDWLLFLDADVKPKNDAFFNEYISFITKSYDAIFGGFAYNQKNYTPNTSLRFNFGKKREEVDADIRNKHPYKVIISANFLIKKTIFKKINNLHLSNTYGMDYVFGSELKEKQIPIFHINNEVYHLGIDENVTFLKKTEQALNTLHTSSSKKRIKNTNISILKAYHKLKSCHLNNFFGIISKPFSQAIKNYLLKSKSPNLFLFDLYRLGYFCRIKSDV